LEEKIKEGKASKNRDHGQINKQKKTSASDFEHLAEKKEGQVGKALKSRVKWT
jgi:hypothetical protein